MFGERVLEGGIIGVEDPGYRLEDELAHRVEDRGHHVEGVVNQELQPVGTEIHHEAVHLGSQNLSPSKKKKEEEGETIFEPPHLLHLLLLLFHLGQMEERFYLAVKIGQIDDIVKLLRDNPALNVNWKCPWDGGATALHLACNLDDDSVAALLLAHPDGQTNFKDLEGVTPFMSACMRGSHSCVRLLLGTSLVKVNEPDRAGNLPLWWLAANGDLASLRSWIASGRDMDLGKPGNKKTDAIARAKMANKGKAVSLLEAFQAAPERTRSMIKTELDITGGCMILSLSLWKVC